MEKKNQNLEKNIIEVEKFKEKNSQAEIMEKKNQRGKKIPKKNF